MDNIRAMRLDEAGTLFQQQSIQQVRNAGSWTTEGLNPLMGGALLAEHQAAQTA